VTRHPARAEAGAPGWRRRAGRSLGLRLVGVFLVLALAVTATFVAGMQRALSGGFDVVVRPLFSDYVDRLAAEIGSPPDVDRARALVQRLPIAVRIDGPEVQWDSHPQRRSVRRWPDAGGDDAWLTSRRTADGHRIVFGLGDVGWSARPRSIGWATLALLLLFTAAAYAYVRHLFRPLDDIRAGALRFGQGDFGTPIRQRRADELGELAGRINTMARELHGRLDAQRALLLAVSHELRSPLTRARLNAELVPQGAERDALLRDLAEMRDLIDDLLESERLALGHAALQREPVDPNALVRAVVDEGFGSAGLRLALCENPPVVPLDAARMRLLLRNLIDNALRASRDAAGPPVVRTAVSDGELRIAVRDFGPGVDAAALPRLGEAFYRPDTARSRSAGGVGLGLHLCRRVAQAHGGRLRLRNADPGFEAEVALPLRG
jgi:signal transduction histidine kinase